MFPLNSYQFMGDAELISSGQDNLVVSVNLQQFPGQDNFAVFVNLQQFQGQDNLAVSVNLQQFSG